MVHNGIEYAIMQLISETYWLMKKGLGFSNDQLHWVYHEWNSGEMKSFLLEITAAIFLQQDDRSGNRLVDMILDKAGSKGTGKWTSQDAMDLGAPVPVIDMAVSMRDLSALKEERIKAAARYEAIRTEGFSDQVTTVHQLRDALEFATIICYAQGLAMLHTASSELAMQIPVPEVVRIWRGGCIIRSGLLEVFLKSFTANPELPNLLLDTDVAALLKQRESSLREIVSLAAKSGFPASALMASLSYFDNYRNAQLPTNLIQAQRDLFGAHTYQRTDTTGSFHTEWNDFQ
jgi:6-phosphogluconate dehydrogenase